MRISVITRNHSLSVWVSVPSPGLRTHLFKIVPDGECGRVGVTKHLHTLCKQLFLECDSFVDTGTCQWR